MTDISTDGLQLPTGSITKKLEKLGYETGPLTHADYALKKFMLAALTDVPFEFAIEEFISDSEVDALDGLEDVLKSAYDKSKSLKKFTLVNTLNKILDNTSRATDRAAVVDTIRSITDDSDPLGGKEAGQLILRLAQKK